MNNAYRDYNEQKREFFAKHSSEERENQERAAFIDGVSHKTIAFPDGAVWSERSEIITETVENFLHGVMVKSLAKLYKTEFYSTDNSASQYCYEAV